MSLRQGSNRLLVGLSLVSAFASFSETAFAQAKAAPKAVIILAERDSRVTPRRCGYSATSGGSVLVTQPAPDTIVVTMTGAAGTGACTCGDSQAVLDFVLDQVFEVEFAPGGPQSGQLILEAHAAGLLRVEGKRHGGTAALGRAVASIGCDGESLASVQLDPLTASCGSSLAVSAARGPVEVPIVPGCYSLHQEFSISAAQPSCLLPRKASVDFAPPSTLESKWIGHPDPFREAVRTNNGFHVTIRVIPDPPVPPPVVPPAP